MAAPTALLIGGTGPTGPHLLAGLERRGFDVTLLHTGRHEIDEVAHVPHLHADVRDHDALTEVLAGKTYDAAVVTYGRLRTIAEVLSGRVGQFISIGGVPAYRGYFDANRFEPPGLPVPTAEDAPTSDEDDDGKSYRIRRTEELLFEHQPNATHFRYPFVYGPRQPAPREWCIVRRILDRRPFLILPDDGLALVTFGYLENLAHAVLLPLDRPEAARGEIFNCGDEECLTLRQVAEVITTELHHDWELISMPADLAVAARPLVMAERNSHRVTDLAKLKERLGYRDVVPAREAVARVARWLADHPLEHGGLEERVLEDPFDYEAEDDLVSRWRAARASMDGAWASRTEAGPGYGLAYAGPGSSYQRAHTRI